MAADITSEEAFPPVEVNKQPIPGQNKDFEVDPASSDVAASKDAKGRDEVAKRKKEREEKDFMQTLKMTILVSAIIAAVAGAAFAIAKKLRQK